jgi:hypothetical protein
MSISDHTSVGSVSGARPELGASGAGTATIPRVRTSRGLSVDVKTSAELPLEDAAALDVLIAERPEVGVFLSRAWLSGFFEEPSPAFEPLLVLFRGDGRLRGIVPIAVRRGFTHSSVRLPRGDSIRLVRTPFFAGSERRLASAWYSSCGTCLQTLRCGARLSARTPSAFFLS